MKKINVSTLSKDYPIYFGEHIFKNLKLLIDRHKLFGNIFLIVDHKIIELHGEEINSFIKTFPGKAGIYIYQASETNKTINALKKIYSELLKNNFNRDTLIISVGGGITGDISGFASSSFVRGVQCVHVPTTLLAMVDSSIGGKTGINFGNTKNIVGSFYQPEFVLIDTDFLSTLPEDELICGFGEVLKSGFLMSDDFFQLLKRNFQKLLKLDKKSIEDVISICVKFKASVIGRDEKEESGLRKILNLGHTFAHAIEIEQKHNIKHGQAVIIGLACALHLSNKMGLLNDEKLGSYLSLILKFANNIVVQDYNVEKLYGIMKRDKKTKESKIKFVLLKSAGNILIDVEADKEEVIYSLKNGLQYFTG